MTLHNFVYNTLGQIHNLLGTLGLFVALELAQYLLDNFEWTWRGLVVAVAGAFVKWALTYQSHTAAKKVVEKIIESKDGTPT